MGVDNGVVLGQEFFEIWMHRHENSIGPHLHIPIMVAAGEWSEAGAGHDCGNGRRPNFGLKFPFVFSFPRGPADGARKRRGWGVVGGSGSGGNACYVSTEALWFGRGKERQGYWCGVELLARRRVPLGLLEKAWGLVDCI